jgi:hypothetical protein
VSLVGIENPRREVSCAECPGGALVGASREVARAEDGALPAPAPAAAQG